MRSGPGNKSSLVAALGDLLFANLAIIILFRLKFGAHIPAENMQAYLHLLPGLCLGTIGLFWLFGLYKAEENTRLQTMQGVISAVALLTVLTSALAYVLQLPAYPRTISLGAFFLQLPLLLLWRFVLSVFAERVTPQRLLLVVSAKDEPEKIEKMVSFLGPHYLPASICTFDKGEEPGAMGEKLAEVDGICLSDSLEQEKKLALVRLGMAEGKEILLIPDVYDIVLQGARVRRLDDMPVFCLGTLRLTSSQALLKRALDIAIASVGLVLTLPFYPVIMAAIFLSSPGNPFFLQKRVGLNGKRFSVIKFRTMVKDAEKKTGPVLAQVDDPRVTKVGAFLRATRLDELPQLFNVLKGEMSIVGPRPERPFFVTQFAKEIPEYNYRHIVKPGITGLAQVLGNYDTSAENKLKYDLLYIRNYSLVLDLKIFFQTLRVILNPEKARGVARAAESASLAPRAGIAAEELLTIQKRKATGGY